MISVDMCVRIPRNAYMGGIAVLVNEYMEMKEQFHKNDIDVSLFSWHAERIEKIKNTKIRNILYAFSFRKALKRRVREVQPDIIHIHTAREYSFLRDVWAVHSIKSKKKKYVLTIHVGTYDTVFNRIPKFLHSYLIRCLNKDFEQIFFLTKSICSEFVKAGLNPEKAKVLYNFHSIDYSQTVSNGETLNLLYVGAIQREKGIVELLEAIEKVKDKIPVHLDICGKVNDGSINEFFEQKCQEMSSVIDCHGYVSGKEKSDIFSKADVLILPSYHEGFPLVILEALATECAIIATPVGAIPEILNENNAFFVPVQDSKAIENAIQKIQSSTQILNDMKKENLALSQQFNSKHHIETLCGYYLQSMGESI